MSKDFKLSWLAANTSQNIQQRAQELYSAFQEGDEEVVALFREILRKSDTENFTASEQDARAVAARERMKVPRLNLEKLKKDAKDFLKALNRNSEFALNIYSELHPEPDARPYKLSDAQLIIARAMGVPSWPKLKSHVELLNGIEANIADNVWDSDLNTLHIRCGSDLEKVLPDAGFKGDFLEISNPFPQGLVLPSEPMDAFVAAREKFVREAYFPLMPEWEDDDGRPSFELEEEALRALPGRYKRIVLWFEHDAFDQLCLAYVLHHLAKLDLGDTIVELVQVENFPGVKRFIGLGQVAQHPSNLALLWQTRQRVTPLMKNFGVRVWQAYTANSPEDLLAIYREYNPPLPTFKNAVLRMLQEHPSIETGLSLTEKLILEIIQREGPIRRGRLFLFLMSEADPQPFLGDVMCFYVINGLLDVSKPAIRCENAEDPNPIFTLTDVGEALLKGELNWLDLMAHERAVGGVSIKSGQKNWFWDNARSIFIKA